MYRKTRELLTFIIQNWNHLDSSVKSEFCDFLQYYRDIVIISKYEKNN